MENKGCPIPDDWLDCLANIVPSPNDLVMDLYEDMVFLNVTRANANWGGPLYRIQSCADLAVTNVTYDGSKNKTLYTTKPDPGTALTCEQQRSGRMTHSHM